MSFNAFALVQGFGSRHTFRQIDAEERHQRTKVLQTQKLANGPNIKIKPQAYVFRMRILRTDEEVGIALTIRQRWTYDPEGGDDVPRLMSAVVQ